MGVFGQCTFSLSNNIFAYKIFIRFPVYIYVVIHFVLINSRLLMDGAPLIAIHKARYFKTSTGLALGPGMFCENNFCVKYYP